MKKLSPLFLLALLCSVASLSCSCSTNRTVGGETLSKRTSLKKVELSTITKMVEEREGRDVFWDGPYQFEEAARHASVGTTVAIQSAFSKFAARHQSERFYVCFDFVVMDGFPKGHAEGYIPKSIFTISPSGAAEWFDLKEPIQRATDNDGASPHRV